MAQTYLMLLWHMHQPFYKDLAEGVYTMPWVRLHALKDYYGMVAILRDFPSVRVTFNLVPSLIVQVEEYARDVAREPAYETAFKRVDALTPEERENRSEEHTSELQSRLHLVCRLLLEKKKKKINMPEWANIALTMRQRGTAFGMGELARS